MSQLLEDCYLKLDRADEHLEAIKGEINSFLARDPYSIVGQLYPGSPGNASFIATGKVHEQPPQKLKILIGEFCHNLRSSLDNLADALATSFLGDAPEGTEFPIFKDRAKFFKTKSKGVPDRGSGLYKMRGLSPGAQTLVKWLQPYRRINNPDRHPLWVLHRLNIGDKHRRPHVIGAVLEDSSFGIVSMRDIDLHIGRWGAATGPFKSGTTVGTFSVKVTGPNPEMQVDTNFFFDIAFDPKGVTGGSLVAPQLTELRDFVRETVFPELEKFV